MSKTGYEFSERSLSKLRNVHPVLVAVVVDALYNEAECDFGVSEGERSLERQKELYNSKPRRTQTTKSEHLIQPDGWVHAVDLFPYVEGKADYRYCGIVAAAIMRSAKKMGVEDRIQWGGNWKTFKDGPHFQVK